MKKEDIDFLKELQHELLTQDTDCQANPRYWAIMQTKEVAVPEGCGEPKIYVGEGTLLTAEELIKMINDDYVDGMTQEELSAWNQLNEGNHDIDMDELVDFANDTMEWGDVRIIYVEDQEVLTSDSNVFLTKRAAKEHIEKNGYHYSKPRTYALTAWRNPEFERVLKIITETDWSKFEEK